MAPIFLVHHPYLLHVSEQLMDKNAEPPNPFQILQEVEKLLKMEEV